MPIFASSASRLPAFVTIRGLEHDYLKHPRIGPQLVTALMQATGCISVSHSLKTLVVQHGVPAENVRVIPNAVDRAMFCPGPQDEARRRLGLQPGIPLIVSVGTLIALKRHHVAIQAFLQVRDRFPTAQLVIIGVERDEPAAT